MTNIIYARTNAYDCLIAIDTEEQIARCLTDDKCELCQPNEVEDASSWEEIDYAAVVAEIEAGQFEIIAECECDASVMY